MNSFMIMKGQSFLMDTKGNQYTRDHLQGKRFRTSVQAQQHAMPDEVVVLVDGAGQVLPDFQQKEAS